MLDSSVWGSVERISPEAPVPIVAASEHTARPGKGANIALNIAEFQAQVTLIGFVGQDNEQMVLERDLTAAGVQASLICTPGHPTQSKLRIFGGRQQLLQLDVENSGPYSPESYEELRSEAFRVLEYVQAVILSDYGNGVVSQETCAALINEARRRRIPLVVLGSTHSDCSRYSGASLIFLRQALSASAYQVAACDETPLSGQSKTLARLQLCHDTVTLKGSGTWVSEEGEETVFTVIACDIRDRDCAGERIVAFITLALASGLSIRDAVCLAESAE